jgi:hypothetical protein
MSGSSTKPTNKRSFPKPTRIEFDARYGGYETPRGFTLAKQYLPFRIVKYNVRCIDSPPDEMKIA